MNRIIESQKDSRNRKKKRKKRCLCCWQVAAIIWMSWNIHPSASDTGFRVYSQWKRQRIIRYECCVFPLKIPYTTAPLIIVSSRLLFAIFWTLKLSRNQTITYLMDSEREMIWMVRHIPTFFYFFQKLILITFHRRFYWWWWWYTCRKWDRDPTTYVV